MSLSPDGNLLAYLTFNPAGVIGTNLYLRSMNNFESQAVPGGETISGGPQFSPDGEWLAFGAGGKLKKISKGGGAPVTVANIPNCWFGSAWSTADDVILAIGGSLL